MMDKPIALIVEDDEWVLKERIELWKRLGGYQAVGARSYIDAIKEFRSTAAIDIVITDVNLDPNNPDDKSGVDLARMIKNLRPDLPIVGYSGFFSELSEDELSNFTTFVPKGSGPGELIQTFESLRERALEYRQKRLTKAKLELDKLRESYGLDRPSFDIRREFRQFLPSAIHPSVADPGESDGIETYTGESLSGAYQLLHVEATWGSPNGPAVLDEHGNRVELAAQVPIWFRKEQNYYAAELLGNPLIYAEDYTADSAIASVLILMYGFHKDFRDNPNKPLAPSLAQLRDYLNTVFP